MKDYFVSGFTQHGVWVTKCVHTTIACVEMRAKEVGIVEILNVKECM